MSELRKDFEEAAKAYHTQAQILRLILGGLVTLMLTFLGPNHTWLELAARAAIPAAGTGAWVLYRGKYPVVSAAEVRDVINWWEEQSKARAARRARLTVTGTPATGTVKPWPTAPPGPGPIIAGYRASLPATTPADPDAAGTPPSPPHPE